MRHARLYKTVTLASLLVLLGILPGTAWAQNGLMVNRNSGQCLDVTSGSRTDGASVIQWPCHGGDNQLWDYQGAGNVTPDSWRVVNRRSGKCLDVTSGSTANGASVVQWACHGGYNQVWDFRNLGNGYYEVKSHLSGKCLDVTSGSKANGAPVIQWTCHGGNNQQWTG
jgi:hypothetical protein